MGALLRCACLSPHVGDYLLRDVERKWTKRALMGEELRVRNVRDNDEINGSMLNSLRGRYHGFFD